MCRVQEFNKLVTPQGELIMESEIAQETRIEDLAQTQPVWVPDRFLAPGVTINFRTLTVEELLQWDDQLLEMDQEWELFNDRIVEGEEDSDYDLATEILSTSGIDSPEVLVPEPQVQDLEDFDRNRELEVELQNLLLQLNEPILASVEDNIIDV